MSSVESEAVFMTRGLSVGLGDADVTRLKALGWCSFAAFAFSSAFQPGTPDETPFLGRGKGARCARPPQSGSPATPAV